MGRWFGPIIDKSRFIGSNCIFEIVITSNIVSHIYAMEILV